MSNAADHNKRIVFGLLLFLLVGGAGLGLYINADNQDPHKVLLPQVLGTWVKIPGVCEGNTHYSEMLEILSKESIKVKGELIDIIDFSISETSAFKIKCNSVGNGKIYAQTSFMAGRFSRYYIGKIGKYTVMKDVAPTGDLWFKLDSQFQQKLQAMNDIKNSRRL